MISYIPASPEGFNFPSSSYETEGKGHNTLERKVRNASRSEFCPSSTAHLIADEFGTGLAANLREFSLSFILVDTSSNLHEKAVSVGLKALNALSCVCSIVYNCGNCILHRTFQVLV